MARIVRVMRFEMPFAPSDPMLTKPELGIERFVAAPGSSNFTMDITLLDTADNRLLRAGVVLAHRVVDGLGEWYLDAPSWAPWLPTERSEPLGAAGDLPDEFASLVRPFRRSAPLGPVAALTCHRVEWAVLGPEDEQLGTLRDDRLVVRRAGVTIGRHREVTLTPHERMTRFQRGYLYEALLAAGGARVDEFPSLTERLGAPATGLTDFAPPRAWDDEFTLEGFTRWLFARRLSKMMKADLSARSTRKGDSRKVRQQMDALAKELRALAFVLEPTRLAQIEQDLEIVRRELPGHNVHQLGDEYFRVLDAIIIAVRAPRLGDQSQHPAQLVMQRHLVAGTTILFDRARSLTLSSADDRWSATLASARQVSNVVSVAAILFGKQARKLEKTVEQIVTLLEPAQAAPGQDETVVQSDWTLQQAYEAGREYERSLCDRQRAREVFVEAWPELEQTLRKIRSRA